MKKTNEDHHKIYPTPLDNLLEKTFAFCAKYQLYYKQAYVVKLTQDREVIPMIEDAMTPTKLIASIPSYEPSTKGKENVSQKDLINKNTLPQSSNPTSTPSAVQNWSLEPSYNNMPSKRFSVYDSTQETDNTELLSPKLSTTKGARNKSARHTKAK